MVNQWKSTTEINQFNQYQSAIMILAIDNNQTHRKIK